MLNLRCPYEQATFDKAVAFAGWHHLGHVRKYTGEPYVNHVFNVARLVSRVRYRTTDMVVAAILHDVLEDTAASESDVEANFGREVLRLVLALSDERFNEPKVGNRKSRKAETLLRLGQESWDVHTIKLADLIDNSATITQHDPNFARVYMREKAAMLEVLTAGDDDLLERAEDILRAYYQKGVV